MRFFTKELWQEINSTDVLLRTAAEHKWNENSAQYLNEFERVKSKLPRRFVTEYLSRNALHDYSILGLFLTRRNRKYACEIQLTDNAETVLITMDDLHAFNFDVESFQQCVLGKLSWGYSEFEITRDGNIKLSILFDMLNEASFEFTSIKLAKQ